MASRPSISPTPTPPPTDAFDYRIGTAGDYDVGFADSVVVATEDTLVYQATSSRTSVTVESGMESTVDYTVSDVSCVLSN